MRLELNSGLLSDAVSQLETCLCCRVLNSRPGFTQESIHFHLLVKWRSVKQSFDLIRAEVLKGLLGLGLIMG